jgi:hypothetical protein
MAVSSISLERELDYLSREWVAIESDESEDERNEASLEREMDYLFREREVLVLAGVESETLEDEIDGLLERLETASY